MKIFTQNSLFSIQIINRFFIFYSAAWEGIENFIEIRQRTAKPK